MTEAITDKIQQSASRIAKGTLEAEDTSPDDKTTRNGGKRDDKQRIEYAEICMIMKKARKDIRKYNQEIIRGEIMASKSPKKVRRKQKLGQDRLITLLDKQGTEIHYQDKS